MTSLKEQLVSLERHAISDLEKITTEQELDEWRINYQGRRNGQLPKLLEELPKLPIEDMKEVGIAAKELRGKLETGYKERLQEIKTSELKKGGELSKKREWGKRICLYCKKEAKNKLFMS